MPAAVKAPRGRPASRGPPRATRYDIRSRRICGRVRHPDDQELPGHRDESTTMIYTHVLNQRGQGFRSPLDQLGPGIVGDEFATLRGPGSRDRPISPARSDGFQAQPGRLQVFPVKLNSIRRGATLQPPCE